MSPRPTSSRKRLVIFVLLAAVVAVSGPFLVGQYTMYKVTDMLAQITADAYADREDSERTKATKVVLGPLLDKHQSTFKEVSDLAEAKPPVVTADTVQDASPNIPGAGDFFNRVTSDVCWASAEHVKVPQLRGAANAHCEKVATSERQVEQQLLVAMTVSDFWRGCSARYARYTGDWPAGELDKMREYQERGAFHLVLNPAVAPAFPEQDDRIHDLLTQVDVDVDTFISKDACLKAYPTIADPQVYVDPTAPGSAG